VQYRTHTSQAKYKCKYLYNLPIFSAILRFATETSLVINTGTTIVTFLMVFLIQNAQNRDGAAIQVKLNELIRVSQAQNSFVGVEHLTEEELDDIRARCEARAKAADERRQGNKRTNGNHVSPPRKAEPKTASH